MEKRVGTNGGPIIGRPISERDFVLEQFAINRRSKAIMAGTASHSDIAKARREMERESQGQGRR